MGIGIPTSRITGILTTNDPLSDCQEGEVLHLRCPLNESDGELAPGYYVLREVLSFSDHAGISFGVVSRLGEDDDGTLVADGETHLLPRHLLEMFVGVGLRAREPFITRAGKGSMDG